MDTNTDTPRDPHNFRENMKKWRKIRGMSQDDLARKITENPPESLTFHQQTIQKIENGNRGISLTDAVLIVVALDVDLNTMLLGSEGPDMTMDEQVRDGLRRDMHVSHLALKELESTLERLEKVFDIAPADEHRESVQRQIANDGKRDDAEAWAKKRHDSMHEQIGEELAKHVEVDHGVDK